MVIKLGKMKRIAKGLILVIILGIGIAATTPYEKNKYFEIVKNIEIFTNLYKELNTNYVDDIDPGKIMRTGIDAMVGSLDPFTNYISESDIEGYRLKSQGNYYGIGAQSNMRNEYVTITELYKDQPADLAGMKVGDQIFSIDGNSAKNRTPEQVNNFLQGAADTEVEIFVKRPGVDKPIKLSLVRNDIKVPNVPYSGIVADDIGYVALTTFTQNAGGNVRKAFEELKKNHSNLKGLILDLRGNGGGLLSEAVNLSNIFIPRGRLVVTTKSKVKDWDQSFMTRDDSYDEEIPLVVLINKSSASASEIVSGVIQDYDRGILIGQKSYGKGLVQNTVDVGFNAKVKITIAKYYIPSGRCIQSVEYKDGEPVDIPEDKRVRFKTKNNRVVLDGGGVKPDIVIEKPDNTPLIQNLIDQNMIFDYVTLFCQNRDSIPPVEAFHFKAFDEFLSFVEGKDFKYDIKSETILKSLKETAQKEGQDLNTEIEALATKIAESKSNALQNQKAKIIDIIEKEIAGRYYYQRGKTQMNLRNDNEVKTAVELLNDPARYQSLLSGEE